MSYFTALFYMVYQQYCTIRFWRVSCNVGMIFFDVVIFLYALNIFIQGEIFAITCFFIHIWFGAELKFLWQDYRRSPPVPHLKLIYLCQYFCSYRLFVRQSASVDELYNTSRSKYKRKYFANLSPYDRSYTCSFAIKGQDERTWVRSIRTAGLGAATAPFSNP